jgi:opacity protein-like surface antigen
MRQMTLVMCAVATLAGPLSTSAMAQDKPAYFILGGGFTAPNSDVRDHLGDGYNVVIGGQYNVTPVIGIEGLYSFNGLGSKEISLPVSVQPIAGGVPTPFFADMNMQYGTASVVVQKPEGPAQPYGVVGMGVYYRPIKVTSPGVGYVPGYCDPWWYVCYPGGFVPVDNIIGERSSTDFGMDFGGGLKFGAFFAEARYHYIWGPEVEEQVTTLPSTTTTTSTDERKANGQFFVMSFGIRF